MGSSFFKKAAKYTSRGFIGAQGDVGKWLDPGGAAVSNLQTGEDPRNARNILSPSGSLEQIVDPQMPVIPEPTGVAPPESVDEGAYKARDRSRRRARLTAGRNSTIRSTGSLAPSTGGGKTLLGS